MNIKIYLLFGILLSSLGCGSRIYDFEGLANAHLPQYLANNHPQLQARFSEYVEKENIMGKGCLFFQLAAEIDVVSKVTPIAKEAVISIAGIPDMINTASSHTERWLFRYTTCRGTSGAWICDFEYSVLRKSGFTTYKPEYFNSDGGWARPKVLIHDTDAIPLCNNTTRLVQKD